MLTKFSKHTILFSLFMTVFTTSAYAMEPEPEKDIKKPVHFVLSPTNVIKENHKAQLSLATSISLSGWHDSKGEEIKEALTKHKFPNLVELRYVPDPSLINGAEDRMIALASVLTKFSKLSHLKLEINSGEKGAIALAAVIPFLDNLDILFIGGYIGPIGLIKLAEGLNHKKLYGLALSKTGASDVDCDVVIKKLPCLPNLEKFLFEGTTPEAKAKKTFEKKVAKHNRNIEALYKYHR